jgi:hypothetical protein
MSDKYLYNLLGKTDLPVVYGQWKKVESGGEGAPPLPYIIFLCKGESNRAADDKIYIKYRDYAVELYSALPDRDSEQRIEQIFEEEEIFYEKVETYLDKEKMYCILYFFTIIKRERNNNDKSD